MVSLLKKVIILGGYGNLGSAITKLFFLNTDCTIYITGRNFKKAQNLIQKLSGQISNERLIPLELDCLDRKGLIDAFQGKDLIINATLPETFFSIKEAVIESGISILDLVNSPLKNKSLESFDQQIKEMGIEYRRSGSYFPGLPTLMLRYLVNDFSELEIANFYSLVRLNWKETDFSEESLESYLDLFLQTKQKIYKNRNWVSPEDREVQYQFPYYEKEISCMNLYFPELKNISDEYPQIGELGFYFNGFRKLFEHILIKPAGFILKNNYSVIKSLFANILFMVHKFISHSFYGTYLHLDLRGKVDGKAQRKSISLYHNNSYFLPAASSFSIALEMLNDEINQPGLSYIGKNSNPEDFFENLSKLGITVIIL